MDENALIHRLLDIIEYKNEYQHNTSGMLPQDMYILERVYFYGKISLKELSKQYKIPPSTLTGIIDRLEEKNLLSRQHSDTDRRSIELVVTPEGKKIVEAHLKEDKLFTAHFFGALSQEKRETFIALLSELLNNIDKNNLFSPIEH